MSERRQNDVPAEQQGGTVVDFQLGANVERAV